MANPLSTLETDLAALATPPASFPAGYTGGDTATATATLDAVQGLFTALGSIADLGSAITALTGGINSGLDDAAQALEAIAVKLQAIPAAAGSMGTVLTTLQNALSTAGSLVPGSSGVSQLQSGSQFFNQLGTLLSDLGSVTDAATVLFQVATQFRTIGQQLSS